MPAVPPGQVRAGQVPRCGWPQAQSATSGNVLAVLAGPGAGSCSGAGHVLAHPGGPLAEAGDAPGTGDRRAVHFGRIEEPVAVPAGGQRPGLGLAGRAPVVAA